MRLPICVRSAEIDILVDLIGLYIKMRELSIFARRPAPIQVNYLGYPGTMGANYIDYIIADQTVIPESIGSSIRKRLSILPNSYQANDRQRVISDKTFTRV